MNLCDHPTSNWSVKLFLNSSSHALSQLSHPGIVGTTLLLCSKIHIDFPGFKQRPLAVGRKKIRASSQFKQTTAREISSTGLFKQSCTSSPYKWILKFKRYPGKSLTYRKKKSGPRIDPSDIPLSKGRESDHLPLKKRDCARRERYVCISLADVLENSKKNLSFFVSTNAYFVNGIT